jgi:transposase
MNKNKYLNHAHISEHQFRQVLKCFCEDETASKTSTKTKISRPTINKLFNKFRLRIVELSKLESPFSGEIEVDESYFGPRRVRGKRGRGASHKIPVIGLLKRKGKVYTTIVTRCNKRQLMPVIKGKILEGSTVYTDGWKSYDGLLLNGYKHYRIFHSKDEFARGKNHINGIESFWSYTKRRLAKLNGVHKHKFILHLKESEFKWNYRNQTYQKLLRNFRQSPL